MIDNEDISVYKYHLEKEFVKSTMTKLVTKSSKLNAAIVLYNHEATAQLNLTQNFDLNRFHHVMENLDNPNPCTASLTRIDRALQFTSDNVFRTDGGSHLNTPKIVVLLTHSASSFGLKEFPLRNASESLKQKGIRLLVVGIGPGVEAYKHELQDITETNDDLIMVKTFSSLFVSENELVNKICSAIDNPSITFDENPVSLFVDGSHIVNCYVRGIPSPVVKWKRNGRDLSHGDLNGTVSMSGMRNTTVTTMKLHFSKVGRKHEGHYTCEAQNKYNTRRRNATILVSCSPSLPIVTAVGQEGVADIRTLWCNISNLDYQQKDSYHWKWQFNGSDIQENSKWNMSYNDGSPNVCLQSVGFMSLTITNFTTHDLGQYKCMITESNTTVGEDDINFLDADLFKPSPPEIVIAEPDDCGRAIFVEWNSPHNEHELQLHMENRRTKRIVFDKSSPPHMHFFDGLKSNAIYEVRIRVNNAEGFGSWAKKQMKTVAERPDKFPVNASSFGCSVKLSWQPPPRKGCPVTRYTIHYRQSTLSGKGNTTWQTKNMEAYHHNQQLYQLRLECSQAYDIIVLGWNERGHSDIDHDSMVTVATESGVPFTPSLNDVIDNKCGEYYVSWEKPIFDSGGGPITSYRAQVQMQSEDSWRDCTTSIEKRSCVFRGLVKESKYHVRVLAINRKGPSDWYSGSFDATYAGPPDPPKIMNKETELTGRNVTVTWRTSDNNCKITMYTVHHRIIGPTFKEENWSSVTTNDTKYTLQLQYSKEYQIIVSSWNKLGGSNSTEWHLRTAQDIPYPPNMLQTISGPCNSINITWSPSTRTTLGGPVTSYLAQIKINGSQDPWHNCSSFDTLLSTSCLFTSLNKDTAYEVRVMAKNRLGYGLPSHTIIRTENTDHPDTPTITNTETSVPACNVTIKWSEPSSNGCPILFYTVHYRQKTPRYKDLQWSIINVTNPAVNHQSLALKCTTTYVFEVKAWNEKGGSHSSLKAWPITTGGGHTVAQREFGDTSDGGSSWSNLTTFFIVACVVFLGLVVGIVIMYCKTKLTKSHTTKRTAKDIQVLEYDEIHPKRTAFVAALGEGAFGKVHLATYKHGLEYFKNNQESSGQIRQQFVAVKELHDNAGEEQRQEFLGEIELMKQIGKHQNVLSFVGCWTTTKPLLLVIEYVAHGDLRQWLIRKRRQIINSTADGSDKGNKTVYADTRIHHEEQDCPQDGNKVTAVQETSVTSIETFDQSSVELSNGSAIPLVTFRETRNDGDSSIDKRDDGCVEDCESFHPADLLSFAWQVARGMSYLAEKGLVHRDLAARNVLVGHGKLLKIADFGLMRQAYHEVYEVKTQRRLPLKWMAPESIYKEIFTSKSDVWSFGVVMWEIATLGGSPYPFINNADIIRLLKTGYRMERPDLCSNECYSVMRDCWKQDPDERPSFQQLLDTMENVILQEVSYFDFSKLDESKDYYAVQESRAEGTGCSENTFL